MDLNFPDPPPVPATRRAICGYCNGNNIPVSLRTIETWDLPYRIIGNKAVSDWPTVIAYLRERYGRAPLHHSATAERLLRGGCSA
jgi:hypothetical protein